MPALAPAERIPLQSWMTDAPTRALLAALAGEARFVGGAVRDALLGRAIGDVDLATPLPPEEVMRRLAAARIKTVPTGIEHGTLTVVVPPRHFEITTLRRDVESFGRHARVLFTDDWAADAARRDFTMNALFLDGDGNVFDPVGGLPDLRAGRVRFVGDAETRIREDVLRLLRFYRFHAHYGRGAPDAAARAACRALKHLLPMLSGERVAAETLKLLAAPNPLPVLGLMVADDVLAVLLPEAHGLDLLAALLPLEPAPGALRRLAALVDGGGAAVAARLRLSNEQRARLDALALPQRLAVDPAGDARAQRRALHRFGADAYRDLALLRAAETGAGERVPGLLAQVASWQPVVFPLKGRDATALGVPVGPAVGRLLKELEAWWEDGDYRADRRQCLDELERRVAGS